MGFLIWCIAWICGSAFAEEVTASIEQVEAAPPVDPDALREWWKAAGRSSIG